MAKIYGAEKTVKAEIAKIKSLPWKEKFPYIWEYYKLWIVGTILVAACAISIALSVIENSKPVLISGILVNNFQNNSDEEVFSTNFAEYLGQNLNDVHVNLSTNMILTPGSMDENTYASVQKISVQVVARDLDFISSDESVVHYYCATDDPENIIYANLQEVLPEDIFQTLDSQGKILYSNDINGNRFPAAIDMAGTRYYEDAKIGTTYCYVGCMINAPHKQNFVNLVRYAFHMELPEGIDPTAES